MKEKLEIIKAQTVHSIKTRYVVADFGKMSTMDGYMDIAEELKDIDIAILILNAGGLLYGTVDVQSPHDIQ